MSELHPIFAECCTLRCYPYNLSQPFERDGQVYAADGQILVRHTGPGPVRVAEPRGRVPNVAPVIEEASKVRRVAVALPTPEAWREDGQAIVIRNAPRYALSTGHVRLLLRHGVSEVEIPEQMAPFTDQTGRGKPEHTCYFRGDGFEGWLMPMVVVEPVEATN